MLPIFRVLGAPVPLGRVHLGSKLNHYPNSRARIWNLRWCFASDAVRRGSILARSAGSKPAQRVSAKGACGPGDHHSRPQRADRQDSTADANDLDLEEQVLVAEGLMIPPKKKFDPESDFIPRS